MSTGCAIPSGARSDSSRWRSKLESDARTDDITLNPSFPPSVAVGVIPATAVGIAAAGIEGASVVTSMGAAADDGVTSCALW